MQHQRKPAIFFSYTSFDEEFSKGALSRFRQELANHLRHKAGEKIDIFQDTTDISLGQHVSERIHQELKQAKILVAIITPSYFSQEQEEHTRCRDHLEIFLERERQLGYNDLVIWVYYNRVERLDQAISQATYGGHVDDPLMRKLAARRPLDWRELRDKSFDAPEVQKEMSRLAEDILEKLWRPPQPEIKFVNREQERLEACHEYAPPYIIFDGPSGYGKTTLLDAVRTKHIEDDWLCVHVHTPEHATALGLAVLLAQQAECLENDDPRDDVRDLGAALASSIRQRIERQKAAGLALFIDNAEHLQSEDISVFCGEFLAQLQRRLTRRIRVRIAGRYIGPLWDKHANLKALKIEPLRPFSFRYVKESVQELIEEQTEPDLHTAYLMYLTGGHPGCMKAIMEQLDLREPAEDHFSATQERYYRDIVQPVAHHIRNAIPHTLRTTFDTLSVFRRYNQTLLEKIIRVGILNSDTVPKRLETDLTATFLVYRRDGLIQDEIVRRVLAIRLRYEERDRFLHNCKQARDIYEAHLLQSNTNRKVEHIAIECLYCELQLAFYQRPDTLENRLELRRWFCGDDGIVERYAHILASKPEAPDIQADFLKLLDETHNDWEFHFLVNFLLRDKTYTDEPYQEMVERIKQVFR